MQARPGSAQPDAIATVLLLDIRHARCGGRDLRGRPDHGIALKRAGRARRRAVHSDTRQTPALGRGGGGGSPHWRSLKRSCRRRHRRRFGSHDRISDDQTCRLHRPSGLAGSSCSSSDTRTARSPSWSPRSGCAAAGHLARTVTARRARGCAPQLRGSVELKFPPDGYGSLPILTLLNLPASLIADRLAIPVDDFSSAYQNTLYLACSLY